jgi:hypothetical protein
VLSTKWPPRDGEQYPPVFDKTHENLSRTGLLDRDTAARLARGRNGRPMVLVQVDARTSGAELLERAPRVAQLDDRVTAARQADSQLEGVEADSHPL